MLQKKGTYLYPTWMASDAHREPSRCARLPTRPLKRSYTRMVCTMSNTSVSGLAAARAFTKIWVPAIFGFPENGFARTPIQHLEVGPHWLWGLPGQKGAEIRPKDARQNQRKNGVQEQRKNKEIPKIQQRNNKDSKHKNNRRKKQANQQTNTSTPLSSTLSG